MKITIHYLAQLKRLSGMASEVIELERGSTLAALLMQLALGHSATLGPVLLDAQGQPQPSLLVFVGEEQIRHPAGYVVREGEQVTLLTPMAGGMG